ncbi:Lrp/AsnC family transcriptional regulator [Microbacterium sp. NPDC076895]|uniref:Lrp/AsnC family transcriptional regulator n=1 Tax=Microbacterium sp. NPDC076895 TaxID=3154957 RepID=UPI00341F452D
MSNSEPDATQRPGSSPRPSPMASMTFEVLPTVDVVGFDDVDRQLLRLLVADPRVSQRQLAREVGMSPPAVGERIARLERQGLITGYTTVVDWAALGYPGIVYIPMTLATDADVQGIVSALRDLPELSDLTVVTGSYDLMARFRIRDHAHLQRLLLDRIWPIRGLQRIETFLGIGEIVRTRTPATLLGGAEPELPALPED